MCRRPNGNVGVVTGRLGSVGDEPEVGSGSDVAPPLVTPLAAAVTVLRMPVNEPLEGRGSDPLPPEAPGRGRPVDVESEPGAPRLERVPVTSPTSALSDGSRPVAPLPGSDPMLPSVQVTLSMRLVRSAPPLTQPLPDPADTARVRTPGGPGPRTAHTARAHA